MRGMGGLFIGEGALTRENMVKILNKYATQLLILNMTESCRVLQNAVFNLWSVLIISYASGLSIDKPLYKHHLFEWEK